MAERNYDAFRKLLRAAICNRTQAQFATDSGISAEHLSRMLNKDEIHRPNQGTLSKIAAAAKNGITLQDLSDALDQEDGVRHHPSKTRLAQAVEDFTPSFQDRANHTMKKLCAILGQQNYPAIIDSVPDYADELISAVPDFDMHPYEPIEPLPLAWELGEARPNFGTYNKAAKFWQPVWLSMSDGKETAESEMIAHFDELPCSDGRTRYVIHGLTCAVKASEDQYGFRQCDMELAKKMLAGEEPYPEGLSRPEPDDGSQDVTDEQFEEVAAMAICSELPYSLDFNPAVRFIEKFHGTGRNNEERLLSSIFGVKQSWQETVPGFGFWMDDTPTAQLPRFLSEHRRHVLDAYDPDGSNDEEGKFAELEAILEGCAAMSPEELTKALDEFQYQDPDMMDAPGWQSAVAVIMRAETGFPFRYHAAYREDDASRFNGLSEKGCITLDECLTMGIQREAIVMATCRYARMLGIKKFGDILFTGVYTELRKPMSYVVKDGPRNESGEDIEPDGTEGIEFTSFARGESYPAKTGQHIVRLKDGRVTNMFWLEKPGVWIKARKEWSHMVNGFNPEPVGPEDQADDA